MSDKGMTPDASPGGLMPAILVAVRRGVPIDAHTGMRKIEMVFSLRERLVEGIGSSEV